MELRSFVSASSSVFLCNVYYFLSIKFHTLDRTSRRQSRTAEYRFRHRVDCMRFVMEEVTFEQACLQSNLFSSASVITPTLGNYINPNPTLYQNDKCAKPGKLQAKQYFENRKVISRKLCSYCLSMLTEQIRVHYFTCRHIYILWHILIFRDTQVNEYGFLVMSQ
jgi:hypothetical protein